ncbi:MsnO8 family LLM class oxidoreductase [Corynebacterium sp. 3HC-13]|uniref:LLM class flavin-dependent oxidoreductase n=1 Tax=Corynebacterium poyangense TaxID=2684405 RepID=UPI001CCEB51D|nr:LLM class flavin-dependent oxidoreductase [Corynebacterium poyangense]MBZ8178410.1 MsnO8 family LLM class oxidoreductase [Corynebacterium poyangense]
MSTPPLSLLDFCTVYRQESIADSLARSVLLAQTAESLGFRRIWYAEHHNMPTIASSHPALLISHIAARTQSIRLGAGGVMLSNHAPLLIAEQFGFLAEAYPDRIDLGVGRAPGTDPETMRALRRAPDAAEKFPEDVQELQRFLSLEGKNDPVRAIPGTGTDVPIFILGSSLFGASLAAALGLPYAFASHFAPDHLDAALAYYRNNYQPSSRYPEPYAIAALNVIGSDSAEAAEAEFQRVVEQRVRRQMNRSGAQQLSDKELTLVVNSPAGYQARRMLRYTVMGTPTDIAQGLQDFQHRTGAAELMISLQASSPEQMMKSLTVLGEAM